MKNFLTVLIVLVLGYFSAHFVVKKVKKKHKLQDQEITKVKEKVKELQELNHSLDDSNSKLNKDLILKRSDLDNLEKINNELSEKVSELIKTNNSLMNENKTINSKLDVVTKMTDNKWLKNDIEELKRNCSPKKVYVSKRKPISKKSYSWSCKNKNAYNKCTYEKSIEWDKKCQNISKYIKVERKVIHNKRDKEYDLNENVVVKEQNYITEIIPEHTILNPNYPKECSKGKLEIPSECSRTYCY
jgi:DNA repair exonuclease SbcCD ATPase subunit